MYKRTFLFGLGAFGLAACAGPGPTKSALAPAARADIRITDVDVDVSKIGEQTKGRWVPASTVEELLLKYGNAYLKGQGEGRRAARAELKLDSVNVISGVQNMLIGGESVMKGTITLRDVNSGEVILEPTELTAGGGGAMVGGLIGVATTDPANVEVEQMSKKFAARAHTLVFGKKEES